MTLEDDITTKAAIIEKTSARYIDNNLDEFINNCIEWFEPDKAELTLVNSDLQKTTKISDILKKMISGGYGSDQQIIDAGTFAAQSVYLISRNMTEFFQNIGSETRKGGVRGHGVLGD